MAYTALYRKYRPSAFKDVVGQDIIVKILKKSITFNKIGHAYLFAGIRGTGKTSVAKIFAKAVNCENSKDGDACNKCKICKELETNDIDIIEIDAASNNGVDEIREIRNNVKLVPSVAKYKVYIIDEVHMLSTGAFNALLKTLEEPPEHVIFILATTEVHKIPLTILSRCQRFDFKKISEEIITERLEYICKKEDKKVNKKILRLISKISDGGLRDAINLLDQVLDIDDINEQTIYDLSGDIPLVEIIELFKTIISNSVIEGLNKINEYYNSGRNFSIITEKLLILMRDISINNTVHDYFDDEYSKVLNEFDLIEIELSKKITILLLDLLTELKKSNNQRIVFEIYFINIASLFKNKVEKPIIKEIKEEPEEIPPAIEKENQEYDEFKKIRINNTLATADKNELLKVIKNYGKIEEYISSKTYNNFARILLEGKPVCAGKEYLLISYPSVSAITVIDNNIIKIENLIKKVFDNNYKITAILDEEWDKIKEEFIKNKKNNRKYDIIEEKKIVINSEKTDTEKEAIDLFGEESITIK